MSSKKYLVVGGTSGIGKEVVQLLVDAQHQVWATSRNHNNIEPVSQVTYVSYDVQSSEEVVDLPEVLHGIVYCPGTIDLKPFNRVASPYIIKDFEVNALGAVKSFNSVWID